MEGPQIQNRVENFKNWCIEQHQRTNHIYDEQGQKLPYHFHLAMVVTELMEYIHLCYQEDVTEQDLIMAGWAHDLIEDCRVNYNDINIRAHQTVADIVLAVTDMRGRNRKERHSGDYWRIMRDTKGASIVKIADRLANVRYSKLMNNSGKLEMYRKEHEVFRTEIEKPGLEPMLDELEKLLNIK